MLEIAIIVLAILFFCGLPVGTPLAICSIVEAVAVIIYDILTKNDTDGK